MILGYEIVFAKDIGQTYHMYREGNVTFQVKEIVPYTILPRTRKCTRNYKFQVCKKWQTADISVRFQLDLKHLEIYILV